VGNSPWSNQVVNLIILTEATTGFSGIFGYSPNPGLGNLIFSIAAKAGIDPYGNPYPAGLDAAGGIGVQTYTQATAPSGTIVTGSIWIDTAMGNSIYIWNGTSWVPYTLGTQAITPGSITATLLSAGIIVAGIVNGTTIMGGTLIADGANGGIFVYSGTPANGNLIGSWAGMAGTDGEGNAYPEGLNVTMGTISGIAITGNTISGGTISGTTISSTTFSGTDFVINSSGAFFYSSTPATGNLIASITTTTGTDAHSNAYLAGVTSYAYPSSKQYSVSLNTTESSGFPAVTFDANAAPSNVPPFVSATSDLAGGTLNILNLNSGLSAVGSTASFIGISDSGGFGIDISSGTVSIGASSDIIVNSGTTVVFGEQVQIPAGNGPFISGETFHNCTLPAGLSGTVRVKLLPWNGVWLDVECTGTPATYNCGTVPSSSYNPVVNRHLPLADSGGTTSGVTPRIFTSTSADNNGPQIIITGVAAGTVAVGGSFMVPTN
jgi:hypothetical protein